MASWTRPLGIADRRGRELSADDADFADVRKEIQEKRGYPQRRTDYSDFRKIGDKDPYLFPNICVICDICG
jgi:hypothetical protein